MIEYLTTEEANLLLRDNDPHYHWKGRGCKVVNKEDFGFCKTHDIDICKPNCGWQWDSQGDWHFGRFTPRLKQYRVFTEEQVREIRSSKLMVFELSYKYHVSRQTIREIRQGLLYINIGNEPYTPENQESNIG